MNEISFEQYCSKKNEVLSKFKEEFLKQYHNYDPMFNVVLEMLIRNVDPYEIIEELITDRSKLLKGMQEFINNKQPLLIIPKIEGEKQNG